MNDFNSSIGNETGLSPPDMSVSANLDHAIKLATQYAINRQHDDGYWYGELMSNVTITAEYVMLRQTLKLSLSMEREEIVSWMLSEQAPDGGWSIAPGHSTDISASVEAYFALKLLGIPPDHDRMQRARGAILRAGGVCKVRCVTRVYLAMFGLFPWEAIPEIPAELILLPPSSPIGIYRLSSWARSTIVPLLIVAHHRPIYALPNGHCGENSGFLDEIWHNPANKNVPYIEPLWKLPWSDPWRLAFGIIDNVLYWLGGLRRMPTRGYSLRKCVKWILDHQEPEGDWAGIFPPMHLGILALRLEGYNLTDPPICRGLEAIERFAWRDTRGKRIQSCVSPVWDTVLEVTALSDAGVHPHKLGTAMQWVKARQLLGPEGDWRVYRPNLIPGGFSFEFSNRWYPDIDDTAAAVIAMMKQDTKAKDSFHVRVAVEWVMGMQCRGGGWGAFDVDNDYTFLNKIPFCDMENLADPPTPDVTGRVLEAFGLVMLSQPTWLHHEVLNRMTRACYRGVEFLLRTQEPSGAWFGRWGVNYLCGTSNALCGLSYYLQTHNGPTKVGGPIQRSIGSAVHWLKSIQNPDGGWGESTESYASFSTAADGPSSPTQSAWALLGLIVHLKVDDPAILKGIQYLLRTQTLCEKEGEASWPESHYVATGFPNHFYLGYEYYPHCFPTMALGRYRAKCGDHHCKD